MGGPEPPTRSVGRGGGERSEATRLLCAGAYLDSEFRRRVIEELVEHEERPVAPSLGIDAVPVLAHAMRARRQEAETALMVLAVWAGFIAAETTGDVPMFFEVAPWWVVYALLALMVWSGRMAAGMSVAVYALDRTTVRQATRNRLKYLLPLAPRVLILGYWAFALFLLVRGLDVLPAVLFPLLLVVPVWIHRSRVAGVMRQELGPAVHPVRPGGGTRLPDTVRMRRIGEGIAREQYTSLTIYDPFRPFVGSGAPHGAWSFALELKRKAGDGANGTGDRAAGDGAGPRTAGAGGSGDGVTGRLRARTVVDLIRPRLEELRMSAAATSRDRLRGLEIEEFVYLPVGPARGEVAYDDRTVAAHLLDSTDEGGEARRHFLRVRVGAWDEQVVVSVLVRVHTQGQMLVLEVAPHVLTPVRPEFKAVDVIAARGEEDLARDGVRALFTAPAASVAAGVSAVRTIIALFRTWLADPRRALPDAPATSIRELGSTKEISLFQEMDVSRYVKTVQDRIASGVRDALRSQGYETGEFEQQIVHVSGGGVFIGEMSGGAVATGERASARGGGAGGGVGGGAGGGST